jgi:hypothetical protein
MKEKGARLLPVALILVFTLTRWPGLMPLNFSAAYALAFCAGVYLPGRLAWWLPVVAMAISDLALNSYYYFVLHIDAFRLTHLANYVAYVMIIGLGKRFNSRTSLPTLVGAGLLGSLLFYLITNSASWLFNPFGNPEYTRNLAGWIIALTKGTSGYPETWVFFRNTLLSGGLFTGLFAGVLKFSEMMEKAEDAPREEEPSVEEGAIEESKP